MSKARYSYQDHAGVTQEGIFHSQIEGQGSDVTCYFQQDNGKIDTVSGERLKTLKVLSLPKAKG